MVGEGKRGCEARHINTRSSYMGSGELQAANWTGRSRGSYKAVAGSAQRCAHGDARRRRLPKTLTIEEGHPYARHVPGDSQRGDTKGRHEPGWIKIKHCSCRNFKEGGSRGLRET
ncbi:hypothetical protein BV25DRAFT_272913 [Artomyces pyxidatus]|uniref:Uncharacterized protein n=1 Tax=Artomyces pyxidatus TaxID=48021 RepID=A0ACB8T855_9AGAM|nr:hypothetical protein BV25DRAFT_272913 [Artomyces pyxidatus]